MIGRQKALLENLSDENFITVEELSSKLQLSEKTIRKMISEIEVGVENHGAKIEKKRGEGVRLKIIDLGTYQNFCKNQLSLQIPDTSEQRIQYILALFFSTSEFIKIDTLCDELFVSRKTISTDLKSVEQYLSEYNIYLERKPYYGIAIRGFEFSLRLCLSSIFYEFDNSWLQPLYKDFENAKIAKKVLIESTQKLGYTLYETDISNIVLQMQIALYRWKSGNEITMAEVDDDEWIQESDIKVAQMCAESFEHEFGTNLPISEIKYLAIHLSGKKKLLTSEKENVVIDKEINCLVNEMIESVNQVFHLDFSTDFELNTSLRIHMVSLRIRLQYHLKLKNPILKEIKEEYSFAYVVAAQAATVLSEYFNTMVSEDEIGYLAVCFALSLERNKRTKKRNILLICASGEGSSKLFEYRFKESFGSYLNKVESSDVNSLLEKDFTDVDYVFSTVPIPFPIPVPIYEIQYFFDRNNFDRVKWILEDNQPNSIKEYFSEDLFFTDIKGVSRDQVIHEMSDRIKEVREVPDDFEESVLYREKMIQTDFCEQIAIPHPYKPITEETFVAVAILDKPIQWHNWEVQVVFLLSVSKDNKISEFFYNIAPRFMMDEDCINKLIAEKNFSALLEIIEEVEEYR